MVHQADHQAVEAVVLPVLEEQQVLRTPQVLEEPEVQGEPQVLAVAVACRQHLFLRWVVPPPPSREGHIRCRSRSDRSRGCTE